MRKNQRKRKRRKMLGCVAQQWEQSQANIKHVDARRKRKRDKLCQNAETWHAENAKSTQVAIGKATARSKAKTPNIVANLTHETINGVKPGHAKASKRKETNCEYWAQVLPSPFAIAGNVLICTWSRDFGDEINLNRYGFKYDAIDCVWYCVRHTFNKTQFILDFPHWAELTP